MLFHLIASYIWCARENNIISFCFAPPAPAPSVLVTCSFLVSSWNVCYAVLTFFLFVCHLFVLVACRLNRMIPIVVGCICDLLLLLLFLFSCSSLFGSRVFNVQTVYYWIDFSDEPHRKKNRWNRVEGLAEWMVTHSHNEQCEQKKSIEQKRQHCNSKKRREKKNEIHLPPFIPRGFTIKRRSDTAIDTFSHKSSVWKQQI